MATSKIVIALVAVVVLAVAVSGVYAGIAYPRTVVSIPISFTVGAESTTTTFDQPYLTDKVHIQITVENGAALWRARILNGSDIIWEHAAAQGEQQSYNSGWIKLPSGSYNFTFGLVGAGSLDATATVTSKGGFW